jgi:hypothetical protein
MRLDSRRLHNDLPDEAKVFTSSHVFLSEDCTLHNKRKLNLLSHKQSAQKLGRERHRRRSGVLVPQIGFCTAP